VAGCGVLDASNALYEDAIAVRLDRDDVAGAFATAERARESNRFVSLAELQTRLHGSGTTVVELATLPREIVAFFVSADRVEVRRTPIDRDRVPSLDEAALYGALVKPAEPLLLAARRVIFVPDRHLADVPFAALHDGERYLLERVSIAAAPSATSLQVLPDPHGPRSLVAVVLPSGDENRTVALRESGAEIDDVRDFYDQATVLPPQTATFDAFRDAVRDAGVVHVAGHTSREPGLGDDALAFAGKSVNWRAITAAALPKEPIVILAACETLRRPSRGDARTLSLGGGFLAAGARGVIGTLTPIADADARELFRAVHRALSSGLQPAEALRSVQLSELKKEAPGQRRAWRSLALLTRAIEGGE
jgi:CHAT domain-containing protein